MPCLDSTRREHEAWLRLRLLVLIKGGEEAIDVFLLQVIRSGEAQLGRFTTANTNLSRLPHPVFEFHTLDRRHVYRHDRAAHGGIRRSPRLGATLHHLRERVVGELAVDRKSTRL